MLKGQNMKKVLIAYFSRAGENYVSNGIYKIEEGNTKIVAEYLYEILECDIYEIESDYKYPTEYNDCVKVAHSDLLNLRKMNILNIPKNINEYDTIFLGFPNYWGTIPMPVYWFLKGIKTDGKVIYPFCTSEGSGFANSLLDIKSLCPNAVIKNGLQLLGGEVKTSKPFIEKWLKDGYLNDKK